MHTLTADARFLLGTRVLRLFAYGSLAVILMLYLADLGLSETRIGVLLTLTLAGDTAISLWLTTRADRFGRRRMLVVGAILMVAAGIVFASTTNFLLLLLAATIGVISPSGNEVGPFLSMEQAALSQVVADRQRTGVFAWYTLAGSLAMATGSLGGGALAGMLQASGASAIASYRVAIVSYAAIGMVLALIFAKLSPAVEVGSNDPLPDTSPVPTASFGLSRSRPIVLRLAALFALDAFAGGFVMQSIAAYWFHVRFGVSPAVLGGIFFGANIFAGLSALLAAKLATRIGLVNTMVLTHLPSNALLILIPFMPNLTFAILVLLLRFSISQMDVPTRQSYVMAVVPPEERSAAAGITSVSRTTGAAVSPLFAGLALANAATFNLPFLLAGSLKIAYDLLLYRSFVKIKPPEEASRE
jgi:MFS family permease